MGPRGAVDVSAAAFLGLCRRWWIVGVFLHRRRRRRYRREPPTTTGRLPLPCGFYGPRPKAFLLAAAVLICLDRLSDCFLVGGPSEYCPLQRCWESYYVQLETSRIREDFHSQHSSIAEHSRSTTEWRRICSIYRSFSGCVQNASRDCVGNLNFHSTQIGVERKMAQYKCAFKDPSAGKRPETEGSDKELEAEEEEEDESALGETTKCNFQDFNISLNRHCAMYGDPHLRTFKGVFQTCRIQGAWPLVDNDFLTVQVTSAPVGVGDGTSISEVTVVIKRNDSCALDRYVTYQAQNGELPGTFDNGLIEFNTVEIFEISPRLHIEIDIGYKQTVIIIRLIGLAYSVSITLPEEVFLEVSEAYRSDGATHLCQSGCPASEQVDLNSFLGQKSSKLKRTVIMTEKEAVDRCRGFRLGGFYFDSCVYDLMTTGDSSFTGASYASYLDLLKFIPDAVKHRNRTSKKLDSSASSSGSLSCFLISVILVLIAPISLLHALS